MKKLYLLITLIFAVSLSAFSETVTESEALEKAKSFLLSKMRNNAKGINGSSLLSLTTTVGNGYYVFNNGSNNGFVIVAGDDNMPEILGYSDKGNINPETTNEGLRWLLDYYGEVAKASAKAPVAALASSDKPAIAPMITTKWGQGRPYSGSCPVIDGKHCLTGCVATSLAQVINYNRWPKGPTATVDAYISNRNNIEMPELPATTFDWDNMSNGKIAQLMLYCGQAVKMNYGLSSSGAVSAFNVEALKDVFGYSRDVKYVERSNYSDAEWENLMYNELKEGRPVIYDGYTSGNSGHSFILHGYDDGKFYINWGWYGSEDGYFQLTNLSTEVGAFNYSQTATIGIHSSENDPVLTTTLKATDINCSDSRYLLTSSQHFSLNCLVYNDSKTKLNTNIGLALYDADNKIVKLLVEKNVDYDGREKRNIFVNGIDVNSLEKGNYCILPVWRDSEADEWQPVNNASEYYCELSVFDKVYKLRTFPLDARESKINDDGIHLIDGIRYDLYSIDDEHLALVLPLAEGNYEGDVYIPDKVTYEGVDYIPREGLSSIFKNCPELTSLSTSMANVPSIWNTYKLAKLELREGVKSCSDISGCMENLEFPKSLTSCAGSIADSHLKTIRFNSTELNFSWYPYFNSLDCLTDVYFNCFTPPSVQRTEYFKLNSNVKVHIPRGSLSNYRNSIWKDWNLVDDQEPVFTGVEWGYNTHDNMDGNISSWGLGERNNVEYAIRIPAEELAAYKGDKISSVKIYAWNAEYVYITDNPEGYLMTQNISSVSGWNTIVLKEPFEITDSTLYVGFGGKNACTRFTSEDMPNANGLFMRAMGSTRNNFLKKFVSRYEEDGGPAPIRIVITGDNFPNDVRLTDVKIDKSSSPMKLKATAMNMSNKNADRFTLSWNLDGKQGRKTIEAPLLAGKSMPVSVDLPLTTGRSHRLVYNIDDIDGQVDQVKANSFGSIDFNIPASIHYSRRIVMEEATGTWCQWCPRGIATIAKMADEYPDNFIAIGLHDSDVMGGAVNYNPIADMFTSYPSCLINRTSQLDPNYPSIKPLVEELKDSAEAKIEATARFSKIGKSEVTVTTATTFGFDDNGTSDLRIAYVVVEDSVGPYNQKNGYSGSSYSPDNYMYRWTQLGSLVSMKFNDVARGIYGSYQGVEGSVPSAISMGTEYKHEQTISLPNNIQNKNNVRIVTLLIDCKSGEILNAAQTGIRRGEIVETPGFEFRYKGEALQDGATVTINAEEDVFGEKSCATNPTDNPKNGLVVVSLDGKKNAGNATLSITSNSLAAKSLQWCMGGECSLFGSNTMLQKSFESDNDGVTQVQFDAANVQSYGSLDAVLTVSVNGQNKSVNIRFVNENHVNTIGHVTPTDDQRWWSNHYENNERGNFIWKKKMPVTLSLAIHVEGKDLSKGATVSAASVCMVDDNFKNLRVWISKTLPKYGEVGDIESVNVPNDSIKVDEFTDIPFSKEYVIPEDGYYVGYTFDGVADSTKPETTTLKWYTSKGNNGDGSMFVIDDPNDENWMDYSDWVYRLYMKVLIGGIKNELAAGPAMFERSEYLSALKDSAIARVIVKNIGKTPIKDFDYALYTDGNLTAERHVVLEDKLEGFRQAATVKIKLDADAYAGETTKTIYIMKVNGKMNPERNKPASTKLVTVEKKPVTRPVVEELTGTWCGWCSRGIIGMDLIKKQYGDSVILIALHNDDPMYLEEYSMSGSTPSCYINRNEKKLDPYYGEDKVNSEKRFGIKRNLDEALAATVAGSVEAKAIWTDADKTSIKIDADVSFVKDVSSSTYRLGYVLLEDSLTGSGSEWAQSNTYVNWVVNPDFEEMSQKRNPITDITYDYVPVAAWEPFYGIEGSLPRSIVSGKNYAYSFTANISGKDNIQNKDKLSVVVLLLDSYSREIVNAVKCKLDDHTTGIKGVNVEDGKTYDVYDMNGRIVRRNARSLENLPHGVYIVNGKKIVR